LSGGVSNMQMRCESTKCSPVIGWNAPIVSVFSSYTYYYICLTAFFPRQPG